MDALTAIQSLTETNNFSIMRNRLFNIGVLQNPNNFSSFVAKQIENSSNFSTNSSSQDSGENSDNGGDGTNANHNNIECVETPSSSLSSSSSSSHSSSSSSLFPSSSSSSQLQMPTGASANAKIIDFRGNKVASFVISGKDMICLPQVYELFLKHMVGGLHTVYTKLRRLDIRPVICNVDQVRALRGLGAIQPGVNRCKLIECSQFDKLYDDCTSTCTRPGRPSKRGGGSGFEDWANVNIVGKKEKNEDSPANEAAARAATAKSNAAVFNQLLPQFTTHQLLMQHFVALTQKNNNNNSFDGNEDEDNNQRTSDDGTPLNLSKSGNSENDSDSLRKEDSSPNNSVSDRAGSNSNSLSVEGCSNRGNADESGLINKVIGLVEIASEQFKNERQELWRERNEVQLLRESFHKIIQEERDLRLKLERETRRCSFFQKRYRIMRRQYLLSKSDTRREKSDSKVT